MEYLLGRDVLHIRLEISKVTIKGQVTIPSKFRKIPNIRPGEAVIFILKDGDLVIKKAVENPVETLRGLGKRIISSDLQDRLREEWEE